MITLTTTSAGTLQSRANRTVRLFMRRSLQPHHVSPTGWALLGVVAKTRGIRPSHIADQLGVQRPMVTQLLREFEKRALIKSVVDPTDTRVKHIVLTAKGHKFVEMLELNLRDELSGLLNDVPVAELTTYFRVLRKIASKHEN